MAEQRPSMTDEDWQRLRSTIQRTVDKWAGDELMKDERRGMQAVLEFMDHGEEYRAGRSGVSL